MQSLTFEEDRRPIIICTTANFRSNFVILVKLIVEQDLIGFNMHQAIIIDLDLHTLAHHGSWAARRQRLEPTLRAGS